MEIFDRIPDISFIGNLSLEDEERALIEAYEKKYKELTGVEKYSLPLASPYRLIIKAVALQLFQGFMWLDNMGKMNLLKYARGEYLDELAVAFGIVRKNGEKAKTKIRFTLSSPVASVVTIPSGTRCTNGVIYFETTEFAQVNIGNTYVDINAECTEIGVKANGLTEGTINSLVDSVAYVASVSNRTVSKYGTNIESDEDLRERVYLAPSIYSVAGSSAAYEYWVREFSVNIADVKITNPRPREVDIRVVLKYGQVADSDFCERLKKFLDNKRPLTDLVQVSAPDLLNYNINVKYWVNASDKANTTAIQGAVKEAIDTYIKWQDGKIGRDINASKLISLMVEAGAKRVDVVEPNFSTVADTQAPKIGTCTVTYGGIEDD